MCCAYADLYFQCASVASLSIPKLNLNYFSQGSLNSKCSEDCMLQLYESGNTTDSFYKINTYRGFLILSQTIVTLRSLYCSLWCKMVPPIMVWKMSSYLEMLRCEPAAFCVKNTLLLSCNFVSHVQFLGRKLLVEFPLKKIPELSQKWGIENVVLCCYSSIFLHWLFDK